MFLTILKESRKAIREALSQLNRETRRFMLNYVLNEAQDESVANAVDELIQILATDLPEDKEAIMTFTQQLE